MRMRRQREPGGAPIVSSARTAARFMSAMEPCRTAAQRVLVRPSMTQRYKMDGRLAGDTPKQRGDIVFDYSNVSEGN
jgi:hypothetical protein